MYLGCQLEVLLGDHGMTSNNTLVPKPKHCERKVCVYFDINGFIINQFYDNLTNQPRNYGNKREDGCAWSHVHLFIFIPKGPGPDA